MSDGPATPPRTWRRRLLRWVGVFALTYLGVVVVMLALENLLLYHPAGPNDWLPPPAGRLVQDVELTSADGTTLHGWWFWRRDAREALVYFHGNAGNLSWSGATMAQLSD